VFPCKSHIKKPEVAGKKNPPKLQAGLKIKLLVSFKLKTRDLHPHRMMMAIERNTSFTVFNHSIY